MNKKSINAIEKIIINLIELKIMTHNRDDNYFYDSYEMPYLCGLVNEIEVSLDKIDSKTKEKYNNINWNVVKEQYEYDGTYNGEDIYTRRLGKVWILASHLLYDELYLKLNKLLEIELPIYYKKYSEEKHKRAIRERNKNEKRN